MTKTSSMDSFFKSLRRSHTSSKGGTKAAEKMNIVQTNKLRMFNQNERTGQPMKAQEWRA
jgi:hypothetical protein